MVDPARRERTLERIREICLTLPGASQRPLVDAPAELVAQIS